MAPAMTCLPTKVFFVALVEVFDGFPRVRILGHQCPLLQEWQHFCQAIPVGKDRDLFEKLSLFNAMQWIFQPRNAIIRIVMFWSLAADAGLLFARNIVLVAKVHIL